MKTADFDYELPPELIAQTPMEPRDHARLLVVRAGEHRLEHRRFDDILEELHPGDALVINETRVIPARLLGEKEDTRVPVDVTMILCPMIPLLTYRSLSGRTFSSYLLQPEGRCSLWLHSLSICLSCPVCSRLSGREGS